LFGLETVDLVLRDISGYRGFAARRHETLFRRYRRQRCGPGAGSQRGGAGNTSKGQFQKMTAFHDISSLARRE
jgi:hypothetical protein